MKTFNLILQCSGAMWHEKCARCHHAMPHYRDKHDIYICDLSECRTGKIVGCAPVGMIEILDEMPA